MRIRVRRQVRRRADEPYRLRDPRPDDCSSERMSAPSRPPCATRMHGPRTKPIADVKASGQPGSAPVSSASPPGPHDAVGCASTLQPVGAWTIAVRILGYTYPLRGPLAQLGERRPCTAEVRGSNPLRSTTPFALRRRGFSRSRAQFSTSETASCKRPANALRRSRRPHARPIAVAGAGYRPRSAGVDPQLEAKCSRPW